MRRFVVYGSEAGNVREGHRAVLDEQHPDYQPPDQRVRDINYLWALWLVVPERNRRADPLFVSAVPEYDPELCPTGVTTEELTALRSGQVAERLGSGQFHPDPAHEHGSAETITAHVLAQWEREQAAESARGHEPAHVGLSG